MSKVILAIKESKPDDWGMLFSAFSASYGIGLLALLGLPFMLGATIDGLGFSESQAGILGTAEFLAVMAASVLMAPFVDKVPRRQLAILGAAIAVVGNLICVFYTDPTYQSLLFLRSLVGVGCGMALAVGNATVSNAGNPEKLAAHMSILFVVLMAITMLVFAEASGTWGYRGMYGALAVCMVCVLPLVFFLPQHAAKRNGSVDNQKSSQSPYSLASILVLLAMLLFALRDMSGWAFVERIGLGVGLTGSEIGVLLSVQALAGICGPFLASVIGSRLGLGAPLIAGIVSSGMVYFVMLLLPESRVAYTVSAMFIGATYFFALSYLTALAAKIDSQGRVVAASGGFLSAGIALGPLAGGYLVERFGYSGTSWFILGMVVLTLIFAMYSHHLTKLTSTD